jgi:hypothetical protein
MIPFTRLDVFATPEQIEAVKLAQRAPLIAMTNPEPPGPGISPVVPMFSSPAQVAHAAALAQGLPEIEGYYGIDLSNGQFLLVEGNA